MNDDQRVALTDIRTDVEYALVTSCAHCRKPAAVPTVFGEWDQPTGGIYLYGMCAGCAHEVTGLPERDRHYALSRIERFLKDHMDEAVFHPASWGPCHRCKRLQVVDIGEWSRMMRCGERLLATCPCGAAKIIERDGDMVVIRDSGEAIH